MQTAPEYDVVIAGAGLAGLALCRHLLLDSDKRVLLLDKRSQIPPAKQKVGESLVQVGGYYFSKVLDLEEYLFRNHYMKYNLRFYWKSPQRENRRFEDYSQAYIRQFSNIGCYQLDRNTLEGDLLRLNRENPRFTFCSPARIRDVELSEEGPHRVIFGSGGQKHSVETEWFVDATGRNKLLARRIGLARDNPIRHGSSFLWVEGLVDIERLTDRSRKEIRLKRSRASQGHLPLWLATNHFMGEGFWFWVIPLQGLTSLGLVYDSQIFPAERVNTPQKLMDWACREFPLFQRDLPGRTILDWGRLPDFSYGCKQTISPWKWAISGEAGRFSDPLYSPGSDLISFHNTLIVDAILTSQESELADKCPFYEQLLKSLYEGYLPTYARSYDALGDQEIFCLKYTWELATYFGFYVFPFINDLFTDRDFARIFLSKFSRLGGINHGLQSLFSDYYQWKKTHRQEQAQPVLFDFTEIGHLKRAQSAFYRVDVSVEEAQGVLAEQLGNLKDLARFILAYVSSAVLEEPAVLTSRAFVEGINLKEMRFDPEGMRQRWMSCSGSKERHDWGFDPAALGSFRTPLAQVAGGPMPVPQRHSEDRERSLA